MKVDEFAFANQQLASMLRDGIPLEGALKRLCTSMRRGDLRTELQHLETDLSRGAPLAEALSRRKLPRLYVQMMQVGAQSNNLPGVLLLLADYYLRVNSVWVRLKGLMLYPLIVLIGSLVLSIGITVFFTQFLNAIVMEMLEGEPTPAFMPFGIWLPVVFFGLLTGIVLLAVIVPELRRWFRWKLPAFRDAALAQFAAAMAMMLKSGCNFTDAVRLMMRLEEKTVIGVEMEFWLAQMESGHGKFPEIAAVTKLLPHTFLWLIASSGEDLAAGFARAADIYQSRAAYRVEMLLYAALPVSVIFLGLMLAGQFAAAISPLIRIVNALGAS